MAEQYNNQIKKKKPTLQFYQAPRGRVINEHTKAEFKVEERKESKQVSSMESNLKHKKSFSQNRPKTNQENASHSENINKITNEKVEQPDSSRAGGLLRINLSDFNLKNESESCEKTEVGIQLVKQAKTLFDPCNPSKPIVIQQRLDSARSNTKTYLSGNSTSQSKHLSISLNNQQKLSNNQSSKDELAGQILIKEMEIIEQKLKAHISKLDFTVTNDLRKQLEGLCMQVCLNHLEIGTNLSVDLNFWKNSYYLIIEMIRKELNKNGQNQIQLKAFLKETLDVGTKFYESLIKNIEERFNIIKNNLPIKNSNQKDQKLASLCIHRSLICLGDLSRYRELSVDTSTETFKYFTQAREYYMSAMHLAPKSGRPYNQLAILAMYTKRRLDAVYYYIRCLHVPNPILTARQSLVSLFDESRKKSESISEFLARKRLNKPVNKTIKSESNRVEIWIKPNKVDKKSLNNYVCSSGGSSDDELHSNQCNELKELSSIELNKRFMLDYLNSIGKLFTRVGMESYGEVCSRMLHEFIELLRRDPCPIGKIRLLQITIVNISLIDLTRSFMNESSAQRSQLQEYAVQLAVDMFACVCNVIMENNDLLPSVKIFIDWLMNNVDFWQPLPDQLHPDLGPNPDLLKIIVNLLNKIKNIDKSNLKSEGIPVLLEEDMELKGFTPFQSFLKTNVTYVQDETQIENAKNIMRLVQIEEFGQFLLSFKDPLVIFDEDNKMYRKKLDERPKRDEFISQRASKISINSLESNENKETRGEDERKCLDDDDQLIELKEKRKLLQAKADELSKREQSVLLNTRKLEIEIRPRFLVADTNCFIDHLSLIQTLIKSNLYIVIVPLIVINEIDKLSKSILNYNDDSIEHAEEVQRNAMRSIEFLQEKFEARERNLKALTSQGTTLDTIQFRTEEVKTRGSNDDLILGCCLHYCHDNARNFMPNLNSNDCIHLFREVVLLTDDRNLRLKAHTRNVPVKNILNFCKWANVLPKTS